MDAQFLAALFVLHCACNLSKFKMTYKMAAKSCFYHNLIHFGRRTTLWVVLRSCTVGALLGAFQSPFFHLIQVTISKYVNFTKIVHQSNSFNSLLIKN